MNTEKTSYDWVNFYQEFADKLQAYHHCRKDLIATIQQIFKDQGLKLSTMERKGVAWFDVDPFSVFGLFTKGLTYANRKRIMTGFAKAWNMSSAVPENFDGIPVLNNQRATLYWFDGERGERDIDNLWDVFLAAMEYEKSRSESARQKFAQCFDKCIQQKGVKWSLTMGLYWMRPDFYVSLDSRNRWYILTHTDFSEQTKSILLELDKSGPTADLYLRANKSIQDDIMSQVGAYSTLPEFSLHAWSISEKVNAEKKAQRTPDTLADTKGDETQYWLYQPGPGAEMWDTFYADRIMGLAWGDVGDLDLKQDKESIRAALKEKYGADKLHRNDTLALWQFSQEMKEGDVIIVKQGFHRIIGRGIVASDYRYDNNGSSYPHVRDVEWTHQGEWEHPGQAAVKTLTNITAFSGYVKQLRGLFETDEEEEEETVTPTDAYTEENFLNEVYMERSHYHTLVQQLKRKKNIILQGAPGVGKTYAAKRLAYSIMGCKDKHRVMMLQFHQSYSYEDFIMGYRPAGTGFELKTGPFYEFCKTADADSENDYFFIIDEINRGNLSKIFGELFMLIEHDKREIPLRLLYSDEQFSVPKNLYIIGMMNTADRSLAMLDYALRRRFSFFELTPAFDSQGFRRYQERVNSKAFDKLIKQIQELNKDICADAALGNGFSIGHSYFCSQEALTMDGLRAIIEHELLPLLKEYWYDEPGIVEDWAERLRSSIS